MFRQIYVTIPKENEAVNLKGRGSEKGRREKMQSCFTLGKVLRSGAEDNPQGCPGNVTVTGTFRGDFGKKVDLRVGESLGEQQVS